MKVSVITDKNRVKIKSYTSENFQIFYLNFNIEASQN